MKKLKKIIKNPRKVLSRLSAIVHYHTNNKSPLPYTLYLAVNNVCNLKCAMCDFGKKNKGMLTNIMADSGFKFESLTKLIDDVKKFKPVINIKAVEPLLYPKIIEFIKYVKKNKLTCALTTNGLLLEKFSKQLVDAELDILQVSIDGPKKIHDKIRGTNCYEKIINGINLIHKFKKEKNKKYPILHTNYAISNLNYKNLVETFNELIKIKFNTYKFQHLEFVTKEMAKTHNKDFVNICSASISTLTDEIDPKKIDINILYNQIKEVKEIAKRNKNVRFAPELNNISALKKYYSTGEFIKGYDKCYLPWMSSFINSDGNVVIHGRCFNLVLGNIHKQSFKEIWNGDKYRSFRSNIKKAGGAFPACSRCCGVLGINKLYNI